MTTQNWVVGRGEGTEVQKYVAGQEDGLKEWTAQ